MLIGFKLNNHQDCEEVKLEQLMKGLPKSNHELCSFKEPYSSKIDLRNRTSQATIGKNSSKRTSIAERIELDCSLKNNVTNTELFSETLAENSEFKNNSRRKKGSLKKSKTLNKDPPQNPSDEDENKQCHLEHTTVLKDIIRKYKIKSIVETFVKKIKRVSVLKDPVEYGVLDEFDKSLFYKKSGFEMPQLTQNIFTLVTIATIIAFSFLLSISLVYPEIAENHYLTNFQSITLVILLAQIVVNLTTVKHHSGKKVQTLIEIWQFYLRGYFVIDILGVIILLCNIFTSSVEVNYLKIIILLKIPQCMDKTEKLEVYFIKNLYNEQYWSLIKILFFNFSFAHIISILLTAMAYLNPGSNWMTYKQIQFAPWYQKYSWSYYWANTIMLTVGFGDIVANNFKQAICLVFIQTFSCMAFAYNINCIGSIIQQIRAKDAERSQRSKIFTKLNDKNKLSEQLSWKISNYIEETARLRKNFNYQEEREFIANLPVDMKRDYLKQSNKNIFESIHFFKSFISKTLYNLAEKIEMRVSHPEEVIQHLNDDYNMIILKTGRLGFACRRPNVETQQFVMDTMEIRQNQNPYLVNLQFISRKRPNYEIKSMEYAIFYFMSYQKFIEVLKETEMDFQFFCTLRDRMKSIPDQFQVFKCDVCKGKHMKALCPKLHYIPFQENIIHKYLHTQRTHYNNRSGFARAGKIQKYQNAFYVYRKSIENVQKLSNLLQSRRRQRSTKDIPMSSVGLQSESQMISESNVEKELKVINQQYKNITMEILKEQITKLIKTDNLQDEVWMLKSDVLYNFNAYFPDHNPANITGRYLQLLELLKSDNVLKTHTTVLIQQVRSARINTKKNSTRKRLASTTKKN